MSDNPDRSSSSAIPTGLRFEDLRVGMRLDYSMCGPGTVIGKGVRAWAFEYDEPTIAHGRTIYAYAPEDVPYFSPFPEPLTGLADHPAVLNHGNGISTEDLSSFVECLSSLSQSRIKGTGREQYEIGNSEKKIWQAFETKRPNEIVGELADELADAYSYIAMGCIKALAAFSAASKDEGPKLAEQLGWRGDARQCSLMGADDRFRSAVLRKAKVLGVTVTINDLWLMIQTGTPESWLAADKLQAYMAGLSDALSGSHAR